MTEQEILEGKTEAHKCGKLLTRKCVWRVEGREMS
jgi:hypothetical protein